MHVTLHKRDVEGSESGDAKTGPKLQRCLVKMQERATSQGMLESSRSLKGKDTVSAAEGTSPAHTLSFALCDLTPLELLGNKNVCAL